MDKLDKEIEEIRRLMLKSTKETVNNRWRLTRGDCSGKIHEALQHKIWKPRGEPATTTRQQQQQQQRRGAGGQLQNEVWDPGGSQQQQQRSHEQGAHDFFSSGV
jgi:hypothetical protein